MMQIGESVTVTKRIEADDIDRFSELTGDTNRIHMEDVAAQQAGFKKRIAQGMFVGSYISSVLGTIFPGEGTIYLEQDLKFLRPVYVDDSITIEVSLGRIINQDKGIFEMQTIVVNERNERVIEGRAVIKYNER